ncbi:MAG: fibronectin type III domain-containing protein [Candidatus Marinimicrobia bacterium]|nr:fibronectin type III domain-containing protein [Candidatus Neomarinimicrobiota bacterium]
MNYKILLIALIISGYFACEDLEHTNPVDPDFVLEAPTNLSVTVINDQSVRLNWDDNCKQEEGFIVECKVEDSAYAEIADLSANTETYTDTDLTYGKNYTYRVKAFADRSESDYSNELQTTVKIPTPTNLTSTIIDEQSVQLTWEDICTFEIGYKVERKEEGGSFSEIAQLDKNITSYTDEGLIYGQRYTYRIKAYTENNESNYSNYASLNSAIVMDIDGNIYQTVKIGDQWWTAENLKVTHYRNGDAIPNITGDTEWNNLTSGAYCNYDNNDNNAGTYGSLYNWFAVDDSRHIAPEGWHVPTDEEWKELEIYLGMSQSDADSIGCRGTNEGGKLKETGTTHWNSPNTGATNESGFSALPSGYRYYKGTYYHMGQYDIFWSSTEDSSNNAWVRELRYDNSGVDRGNCDKCCGFSVRCVKD